MDEGDKRVTQLVVVGASAGGIEALTQLVGAIPADFPASVVVAQHLSPNRPNALAEILGRHGKLTVRIVETRELLEPGVIYVVPPNHDVTITDHEVRVQASSGGPRPSVDRLFRTAAEAFGENLIAVILSGTGSDGAVGARIVKEAGGTVLVQNPETAAFPGMPLSLAPSMVDIVADASRIGALLADLVRGEFVVPPATEDTQLRDFLDQLRVESGIDFTAYKQPTIARRLQRRMAATGQVDLRSYLQFAWKQPEERQRLVASFLIKVTEFFRDREVFDYLRTNVLPELMESARGRDGNVRFWSAGCATGEEAYSLAMVVADALGEEANSDIGAKIFATDVDPEAVNFARRGVYPARALTHVPPDMIDRYFTSLNGEYEVRKSLRSLVVFGEHDLARRAAFPRTDLILCRNVLIYFTPSLQRRALQLFAFSLRSGGYLVLGKSETTTPVSEFFAIGQPRLKIFHRIGERIIVPPTWGREPLGAGSVPRSAAKQSPNRIGRSSDPIRLRTGVSETGRIRVATEAEEVLLSLPIGVVLVDINYDIQNINAVARRYFGIHTSALGLDLIHQIQSMPTVTLRQAIDRAIAGEKNVSFRVTTTDEPEVAQRTYDVTCHVLNLDDDRRETLVEVTAIDVTDEARLRQLSETNQTRIQHLEASNQELLVANAALTDMMAKLRSENEDLQVAHEEAQAATEEVETLNEEMQATNEELETLNEELQATVEELNTTNDDLEARSIELQDMAARSESDRAQLATVLQSLADAVIVVDRDGQIILANAAGERLFGTAPDGLTVEDEDGQLIPPEQLPAARAARGETFNMIFVVVQEDGTRRTVEAAGQPVPDEEQARGVVTTRDVTERSLRLLQDRWLAIAAHELRTPLTALQAGLQLASRSFASGKDERGRQRLAQALEQSQRVGFLVSQLMDASRLRTGHMTLSRDQVDLLPLVEHAAETARLVAPDRQLEVVTDRESLTVMGDQTRLEQALLNLLNNAVSYAPPDSPIIIRVDGRDSVANVEIVDRGPGIPADELSGIFDQYHRLERGSRERPGGLGLGLFITREIVQAMAGTIEVSSRMDVGTTFTIRLPLAPTGAAAGESKEST